MIVFLLVLLLGFYICIGWFLGTKPGKWVEAIALTIVSLPVLIPYGIYKLIKRS